VNHDHDIDRWVDTLAGRRRDDGLPDAARLRAALRGLPPEDEVAIARELAAMRNRGGPELLDRARTDPVLAPALARRPDHRRKRWPAVAAAVLAGIAVAWFARMPDPYDAGEPGAVREAPGAIQRLDAAEPRRLRDEIAEHLRVAGIEVRTYERFGRSGLDADLPGDPSAELSALLVRYGLALPSDGVLRVEVAAPDEP